LAISTPPSGPCYCCWSSGSFVAEAGGIEVGAENWGRR
jgi:hypothetical protein